MNIPHLHILLNHVPTVGFGIGIVLFFIALFVNSRDLKRASLGILFFIAIMTTAVYVSGSSASEEICPSDKECLSGVAKNAVSMHEDAALLAYMLMQVTGALAFLGLWRLHRTTHVGGSTAFAIVILSAATFASMARAANIGGEIRHPEILESPTAAITPGFEIAWLKARTIGSAVLSVEWAWPASETLHFLGLCLLFSVVLIANLRILGVGKALPISAVHKILPWALLGFGVNTITGMLFYLAAPQQYNSNVVFFWKVVFIVVAGANAVYFLVFDEAWTAGPNGDAPLRSKIVAASAIVLWIGVLFCGHMLPFLGNAF